MRCTDTNSKGKAIFQTESGAYFGLTGLEMEKALQVIQETLEYNKSGGKRKHIDSRTKRNY